MRLTRPTLVNPLVITSEAKDLPNTLFSQILENDVTSVRGTETIAAGQFMLLPQSFGNIYLGETFSSYICVHNCTPYPVQSVVVKVRGSLTFISITSTSLRWFFYFQADLQSDKTRISLPIHANQTPITLQPNETLDDVIHHEVKEIGIHMFVTVIRLWNHLLSIQTLLRSSLVCEVHYATPSGLQETFRKFFKFQVMKPLDVKTKFYNADNDEVYLEAQVS